MPTPRVIGSRPQPTTSRRPGQRNPLGTITPYTPQTRPPAGTYDPNIDAQVGAANRGLQDLRIDTEVQGQRLGEDFGFQAGLLGRDRDRGLFDLTRGRDRSLEDLLTTETRGYEDFARTEGRGREDYGLSTEDLRRNYQQLGRRQAEASRVQGVLSGGLAGLSAGKRAENQGREQSRLDLSLNRLLEDVSTGRTRLGEDVGRGRTRVGEDYETGSQRIGEDYGSSFEELSRNRDRGIEDLALGLGRAEREGSFFDTDAANQRWYQAAALGYEAPPPPAGRSQTVRSGGRLRFGR